MRYDEIESPVGPLLVATDDSGLRLIHFQSGPAPRRPDPAWRRRALAAALLFLALAGPRSAAPVERIPLWVDDSLSMLARGWLLSRICSNGFSPAVSARSTSSSVTGALARLSGVPIRASFD